MSITRPFEATDVLKFNQVNADPWTATYGNGYYASYLAQWPEWCVTTTGAFDTEIQSYMIAKHEPAPPNPQHHGHLTALSISPPVRGLGLARFYMDMLERLSGPAGQVACDHDHNEEGGDHGGPHPHSHSHAQAGGDCVDAWFVDLFVRCNNGRAVDMYEKLGYSVYRRVVDYYSAMDKGDATRDELDGFDMRKSMPKDTEKRYVRSNGRDILVSPDQVWS